MQIEPKLFSPSVYFSISHRQFPNCAHVCVPIEVSLSLPVSVSGQESEGLWCLCVSVCIHTFALAAMIRRSSAHQAPLTEHRAISRLHNGRIPVVKRSREEDLAEKLQLSHFLLL